MITTKQWWPDGAMGYANTRWAVRSFRERNPYVVALIGITLGTLVMLSVLARDQLPIIGGGTHYSVDFTEAGGLRTGDDVSVAGVTVGRVTAIALEGSHVRVTVLVRDTWLGNQSTAAIKIKTLLGSKYLAISPRGTAPLDPDTPIPTQRTT